ncbi:unnamed protein product [Macrosiphum euphorbiae]|uniref:Uncharacterized protein n=1 Tax=Macrosiphum euphorbiae TaxID=13131 RepID=A0AAV0W396_9HEMI|nr:unnamed protein product [Macrosiphum euphorbiae]
MRRYLTANMRVPVAVSKIRDFASPPTHAPCTPTTEVSRQRSCTLLVADNANDNCLGVDLPSPSTDIRLLMISWSVDFIGME